MACPRCLFSATANYKRHCNFKGVLLTYRHGFKAPLPRHMDIPLGRRAFYGLGRPGAKGQIDDLRLLRHEKHLRKGLLLSPFRRPRKIHFKRLRTDPATGPRTLRQRLLSCRHTGPFLPAGPGEMVPSSHSQGFPGLLERCSCLQRFFPKYLSGRHPLATS